MSEESVEIVRAIYDAQARGDIDAIYARYSDEIEWHDHVWGGWGTVRGIEALRARWEEWAGSFGSVRFTVSDLAEIGDQVLAELTVTARSRAAELNLQQPLTLLYTIQHGKVIRVHVFRTRGDAVEAAGLSA
jgi:ketosteroid isomerase-like protein